MQKITSLFLAFTFSILVFIGCTAVHQQYAIQGTMIALETQLLAKQYTQVETLMRNKQEATKIFTEEEWRKLLNVDATVDMIMTKYDTLENMDMATINIQDLMFMWQLTTEGYTQAREVVEGHYAEFSPSSKMALKVFDQQAIATNDRIAKLLLNPDSESINQSLILIASSLGLAVKVVGMTALL